MSSIGGKPISDDFAFNEVTEQLSNVLKMRDGSALQLKCTPQGIAFRLTDNWGLTTTTPNFILTNVSSEFPDAIANARSDIERDKLMTDYLLKKFDSYRNHPIVFDIQVIQAHGKPTVLFSPYGVRGGGWKKNSSILGGLALAAGGVTLVVFSGGTLLPLVGAAALGGGVNGTIYGVKTEEKNITALGLGAELAIGAVTGSVSGGLGAGGDAIIKQVGYQGAKKVIASAATNALAGAASVTSGKVTKNGIDAAKTGKPLKASDLTRGITVTDVLCGAGAGSLASLATDAGTTLTSNAVKKVFTAASDEMAYAAKVTCGTVAGGVGGAAGGAAAVLAEEGIHQLKSDPSTTEEAPRPPLKERLMEAVFTGAVIGSVLGAGKASRETPNQQKTKPDETIPLRNRRIRHRGGRHNRRITKLDQNGGEVRPPRVWYPKQQQPQNAAGPSTVPDTSTAAHVERTFEKRQRFTGDGNYARKSSAMPSEAYVEVGSRDFSTAARTEWARQRRLRFGENGNYTREFPDVASAHPIEHGWHKVRKFRRHNREGVARNAEIKAAESMAKILSDSPPLNDESTSYLRKIGNGLKQTGKTVGNGLKQTGKIVGKVFMTGSSIIFVLKDGTKLVIEVSKNERWTKKRVIKVALEGFFFGMALSSFGFDIYGKFKNVKELSSLVRKVALGTKVLTGGKRVAESANQAYTCYQMKLPKTEALVTLIITAVAEFTKVGFATTDLFPEEIRGWVANNVSWVLPSQLQNDLAKLGITNEEIAGRVESAIKDVLLVLSGGAGLATVIQKKAMPILRPSAYRTNETAANLPGTRMKKIRQGNRTIEVPVREDPSEQEADQEPVDDESVSERERLLDIATRFALEAALVERHSTDRFRKWHPSFVCPLSNGAILNPVSFQPPGLNIKFYFEREVVHTRIQEAGGALRVALREHGEFTINAESLLECAPDVHAELKKARVDVQKSVEASLKLKQKKENAKNNKPKIGGKDVS